MRLPLANTREFCHGRRAGVVLLVKWAFLTFSFPVPLAVLLGAFVVQYAGLIAEWWYFFARAKHPPIPLLPGDLLRWRPRFAASNIYARSLYAYATIPLKRLLSVWE